MDWTATGRTNCSRQHLPRAEQKQCRCILRPLAHIPTLVTSESHASHNNRPQGSQATAQMCPQVSNALRTSPTLIGVHCSLPRCAVRSNSPQIQQIVRKRAIRSLAVLLVCGTHQCTTLSCHRPQKKPPRQHQLRISFTATNATPTTLSCHIIPLRRHVHRNSLIFKKKLRAPPHFCARRRFCERGGIPSLYRM